ncbi:VF530 family DNA-binding protein [Pontiella agarivorans]|uniref:VF530 family DNA-binding protein n=1 Tax=Pontiella agarivorans TaxID=3038953 RepID=A0ABU5N0K7_9BACT|nr:VF530 family DNA-binding protein [Pontiella agarivorans]MDZ8119994.1 VF530 family DNA-binding protein [Pontiella agarivorans]
MENEELQNSPLHGLSAEAMLTELVEFYGWRTLDAAIELKCFRIQPTIPSALAFLKKAEWARNRVEEFYLYVYKGMPKGSPEQMALKPRERGFPLKVKPKKPRPLKPEEIKALQAEREALLPPGKRAPKRPPHRESRDYREFEEPGESSFKSKFSSSPFKKPR